MQGALGVVLQGLRRPERGHHCVARELLDRSPRLLDLRAHRVVEPLQPSPRPLRIPVAFIAELLAAVPSIIYGMWGFLLLAPWLQHTGEPWLQRYLGFLPFFQGPYHGLGILAAGIILVIMVLPLIISVSREIMLTVPRSQREARGGP